MESEPRFRFIAVARCGRVGGVMGRDNRRWLRRGVVLLALALGLAWFSRGWQRQPATPPMPPGVGSVSEDTRQLVRAVAALEAQERGIDETVWAPEILAQHCGRLVDRWWDRLNESPEPLAVLDEFPWPPLVLPRWAPGIEGPQGIHLGRPTTEGEEVGPALWRERLRKARADGWRLIRIEPRQIAFATNDASGPATSRYRFSAWLEQPERDRRAMLQGELTVVWGEDRLADGSYAPARVDASQLGWQERAGPVPWVSELFEEVAPPEKSFFIDPVLLHDLDADGIPEIILAAKNRVYRRDSEGRYTASNLCGHDPGLIFTAVLADTDGDGATDLLCAKFDGLWRVRGTLEGRFPDPGERVWSAPARLRYGQVLTAGDVDGDGDLDLWLGQYKAPYERGQMPTPYYDADDGYPSFLLINDGQGQYRDGTDAAGLGAPRNRRTYSASLADVNGDGWVDLLVVSDFAGVELHLNDGAGRFRLATGWFPEPQGFGMAHAFGDFDADGRVDVLVTGMQCPSAWRLDSLGLRRPGFEAGDTMRPLMTRGNLLFQRTDSGFERTQLNEGVAESGWAWSPAAADYDNDGFLDLYVANGHETRRSVVDYEPQFWLHDIYVASSRDDLTLAAYFGSKFARTRGQGESYGGYEANRFFLNRQGTTFLEAGWLLGVAVEQDSRNAAAVDLNADGRSDLVVTTFEVWPRPRQTVRVFRNEMAGSGHWIGVRLRPVSGVSPLGAEVTVHAGGRRWVRMITSGDLHRVQSPWSALVGLGAVDEVERVEIRWPNGVVDSLVAPAVDRYYTVTPKDR